MENSIRKLYAFSYLKWGQPAQRE